MATTRSSYRKVLMQDELLIAAKAIHDSVTEAAELRFAGVERMIREEVERRLAEVHAAYDAKIEELRAAYEEGHERLAMLLNGLKPATVMVVPSEVKVEVNPTPVEVINNVDATPPLREKVIEYQNGMPVRTVERDLPKGAKSFETGDHT